jgi:glycosyltransferase involved in cell wall biosynthesis
VAPVRRLAFHQADPGASLLMGAVRFSIDPGLVRQLVTELPLDVFVETGTYRGASVREALPYFNEIHTIELSEELYEQAKAEFAEHPQVTVHHGRSEEVLKELAPKLKRRKALFWLDAHWSDEPGAAGSGETCPLPKELEAIGSLGADSVVMIDDARLFLAPPPAPADAEQWPDLKQVLGSLSSLAKGHEPMVIDDVIVFFPGKAKQAVREYARDEATDWLAELGRAAQTNARLETLEAQIETMPERITGAQANELQELVGEHLGAIRRSLAELGAGSARLAEAREEIRALGSQIKSVQEGIAALSESSRATQEAVAEVRLKGHEENQALRGYLERLDRRIDEVRLERQEENQALRRDMERLGRGIEEARQQRAHIEEVQRLVMILVEAEAARRGRRGRIGRALISPLPVLARPLRRPWNRVKRSLTASAERWRVRLSRLRREPKLGQLQHHPPMELQIPKRYLNSKPPENPPSISIVTPSYNQAEFLERTIKSVVEQEYPRLEYIVQDGNSSDRTREVLERHGKRLKHWEMRADDGQAQAINRGFAHATGEVMGYLNSDDLLLPGSLRYIGRYFEAHPEADAIYGHRVLIDEEDREIGRWVLPRHRDSILSWADYVPQETLFWRRQAWDVAGGSVNEEFRFAIDWDLLLRMRDAGARIVRVPRFLGAFRVHTSQKTSAQIDLDGADEMARIRNREHQRKVSPEEVDRAISGYLRRHVYLHKLYRAHLIRY